MKLRELQYIILPFQDVVIVVFDDDESNNVLDILYDGPWYRANHMNCDVVSIYVPHHDYKEVIVLEVDDVRDN